jgi:S1-C subfamily serine protease
MLRALQEPALRAGPAQAGRGGWLGVALSESGTGDEVELEITDVTEGSAAARAGLRAGDHILSLNERPAGGYAEFAARVQDHGPGTRVQISIERETEARLADEGGQARLGVTLGGASASSVASGSAAEQAGIQAGDRLVSIGGEACASADDVIAAIRSHEPGDVVGITLRRTVPVVLGNRPGAADETPPRGARPGVEAERAAEAERRADETAERRAEAERRSAEAERRAQISNLQGQLRELSAALERLRRELDELQRELAQLR